MSPKSYTVISIISVIIALLLVVFGCFAPWLFTGEGCERLDFTGTGQIGGMQHSYWYPSISPLLSKENVMNDVYIGNDVWIAAGAIIAQGVSIGNGALIGANSFVNKDVPPYAIVVGTPARIFKFRFSDDVIVGLQNTEFWEMEPNEAKVIVERFNEKYLKTNNIEQND